MVMRVEHQLPMWQPGFTAYWAAKTLDGMARGYLPWAAVNPLPPLYSGRIRYRIDAQHGSGVEVFSDPWTVAARGYGDCNDLVLYRLIELMLAGERVSARDPNTRSVWDMGEVHVLVRRANGRLEDPSLIVPRW